MEWSTLARETIQFVTMDLPDDMPLADRMAVVDAAYPFGARERWPYKAWLAARKRYLRRFGYIGRGKPEPAPLLEAGS